MDTLDSTVVTPKPAVPAVLRTLAQYKNYLLAIAVIAALVLLGLFQMLSRLADSNRELVQQELHRLLSNDVNFERLEATLWGGLGFTAKEFTINDDRRFAATPFLRAKELHLGVSLWDLIHRRIVVDTVSLNAPEFQIITNENSIMNVSALAQRKKELRVFQGNAGAASADKRHAPLSFALNAIHINDGQLYLIDRSVPGTAELQVKNVEMHVTGLDPARATRIRIAAAVTEGLTHDMLIQGTIAPSAEAHDWSQRDLDFDMHFDSLHLPLVVGALPMLKDRIPAELGVTGPLTLHAKVAGTMREPMFTDIDLKIPLFGSSDYNAVIRGQARVPENRDWVNTELTGTFNLYSVGLAQLHKLPFLKSAFSNRLRMDGPMRLTSNFAGTWNQLRVGARFDADGSEILYGPWLRKPAGTAARWTVQFARRDDKLLIRNSTLQLGKFEMAVTGEAAADFSAMGLQTRNARSDIAALVGLTKLSPASADGSASWDLRLEKDADEPENPWSARGVVKIAGAKLQTDSNSQAVEDLNATILFIGRQVRTENASLRYGTGNFSLDATIDDLADPRALYTLRAAELRGAGAIPVFANPANVMHNVVAKGEAQMQDTTALLHATLTASDGVIEEIPFDDMRAEIVWSPEGVDLKQFSLHALSGTVQGSGSLSPNGKTQNFEWSPRMESIDLAGFVDRKLPNLKNRFAGQLVINAQLSGSTPLGNALNGAGEAQITNGTMMNFNLLALLFGRGNKNNTASRLPAGLAALVNRSDTPFDSFKGAFKYDQERLSTDNLVLSTPDYSITGAGWIAADRTTRWNGLLVLSPAISQGLQSEYKMLRHFVDRRGRLSIAFKIDGTLPNIRIRPENRALAQAFRWGSATRGGDGAGSENKSKREWLPESLDQFLSR